MGRSPPSTGLLPLQNSTIDAETQTTVSGAAKEATSKTTEEEISVAIGVADEGVASSDVSIADFVSASISEGANRAAEQRRVVAVLAAIGAEGFEERLKSHVEESLIPGALPSDKGFPRMPIFYHNWLLLMTRISDPDL